MTFFYDTMLVTAIELCLTQLENAEFQKVTDVLDIVEEHIWIRFAETDGSDRTQQYIKYYLKTFKKGVVFNHNPFQLDVTILGHYFGHYSDKKVALYSKWCLYDTKSTVRAL